MMHVIAFYHDIIFQEKKKETEKSNLECYIVEIIDFRPFFVFVTTAQIIIEYLI